MTGAPLVVPISVEAWCVSPADATPAARAAPAANFAALPTQATDPVPYLSESVIAAPFTNDPARPMPGVHLHWALPDALARATHGYRVSGQVLNELRLLGLPAVAQLALARHLAAAHPADPDLAALVALLADPAGGFDHTVWAPVIAADLAAAEAFPTPEAFLGTATKKPAAGTMAAVLGRDASIQQQPLLVQAAGSARFPAAPDRWIVVRAVTGDATQTLSQWRARIVESDFVSANAADCFSGLDLPKHDPRRTQPGAHASTVPADADAGGQPYRYLGRASELETWREDPEAARYENLTALGWGLPTFAASYPDCRTVFGHCDELADLGAGWPADSETTRLSYTVIGWHSDPADDPLARAAPADLGWAATGAARGDAAPARTLYAGSLYDLRWDPTQPYAGGPAAPPDADGPTPTQVVVANTAAEALATLIGGDATRAAASIGLGDAELVEALQLGLLDALHRDGAAALANLESQLHRSAFGSEPAGVVWGVVPAGEAEDHAAAGITLAPSVAGLLAGCNTCQRAWEDQLARVAAKRSRLFAAWHLYLQLSVAPPHETPAQADLRADRSATLQELLVRNSADASSDGLLPQDVAELSTLAAAVGAAAAQLQAALGDAQAIVATPAPRYWRPAEPVVLLTGDAARPTQRYGSDGLDHPGGLVSCRPLDRIIATSGLGALTASPLWPAAVARTPGLDAERRAAVEALLCEALLLDARIALPVAGRTALIGAVEADDARPQPTYAHIDGWGWPPARNARTDRGSAGLQNPWHPIAMHWRVALRPEQPVNAVSPPYPHDVVTTRAQLDPAHIDLTPVGYPAPALPSAQYEGIAILTARAQQTLAAQARAFLGMGTIPEGLAAKLQAWERRDAPVLSQALSGFNDALLMRTQQLQLRIASPGLEDLAAPVATWVGTANRGAPVAQGAFNPLRFGVLDVGRLRLVDTFGQVSDVALPAGGPTVAPSLQAEHRPPGQPHYTVALPPRIAQPARLLFRWRSAADDTVESNDHPATSPVCGWIVANHLDESLMVYGADGTPCGSLRTGPGVHPIAVPPPGAAAAGAPANVHMAAFVAQLLRITNQRFTALLAELQRILELIEPSTPRQDDALAVLMGRPLALARASLQLDVAGLTANDASAAALDGATARDFGTVAVTHGFEALRFPVRLGDLARDEDGLVGFFAADDYDTFVSEDTASPLTLSIADGEQLVSLLLDPRAPVHATAGVVPVESIAIPPDQYQAGLQALRFAFLAAPVVGHAPAGAIDLPLPAETTAPWHWLGYDASGAWAPIDKPGKVDDRAALDPGPRRITEGWLAIRPREET